MGVGDPTFSGVVVSAIGFVGGDLHVYGGSTFTVPVGSWWGPSGVFDASATNYPTTLNQSKAAAQPNTIVGGVATYMSSYGIPIGPSDQGVTQASYSTYSGVNWRPPPYGNGPDGFSGQDAYSTSFGLCSVIILPNTGVMTITPTSLAAFVSSGTPTTPSLSTFVSAGTIPSFLTINSGCPANGIQNVSYTTTLTATGGTTPYTFTISSGSLPPGLSLASNGTISGTPTTLGTYSATFLATDAYGFTGTLSCASFTINRANLTFEDTLSLSGTSGFTFGATAASIDIYPTLSAFSSTSSFLTTEGLGLVISVPDPSGPDAHSPASGTSGHWSLDQLAIKPRDEQTS